MSESGPPGAAGSSSPWLEALRVFRAGPLAGDPSDRALARAAGVSPTTIGDWLRGGRFPQDIGKVLAVVRMVRAAAARRGVAIPGTGRRGCWMRTGGGRRTSRRRSGVPVSSPAGSSMPRPSRALAGPRVRVGEADLRLLGVHEAISVPGVSDEVPPEYVPRDVDAAEFGVRAKVEAAAQRGGFVLLVGGSSVGKTRMRGGGGQGATAGVVAGASGRAGGGRRAGGRCRRSGRWCGSMSCSVTWTASTG